MQFAKVFDIEGAQVLFLLQPRDEDGVPELKMITYVGKACVVLGNRLVPPGAPGIDPEELLAKTRELFDGFGQKEAEQAYRMAQQLIANARELPASEGSGNEAADAADSTQAADSAALTIIDSDFGVPWVSTAKH
jgi:hypothetical protein